MSNVSNTIVEIPVLTLKDVPTSSQKINFPALFSLANGHFGVQATDPISSTISSGTLVNGFFEFSPITYGESAAYYPKENETIIDLPNLRKLKIETEDHIVFDKTKLIDAKLNLANGLLNEIYELSNINNDTIILKLSSLIGQNHQTDYGISYEILPESYIGKVIVNKVIETENSSKNEQRNGVNIDDPRKSRKIKTIEINELKQTTHKQIINIRAINSDLNVTLSLIANDDITLTDNIIDLAAKPKKLYFNIKVSFAVKGKSNDKSTKCDFIDFNDLFTDNSNFWLQVWQKSNVTINGNPNLNLAIHYNIFQLNESAGRDGKTNVASKGLSGSGYEGHYFWDTEMYMLPYFINTQPDEAKKLIIYRYNILDFAKNRARELGIENGALYAWRTINGQETSAYYPASTAAYHIDGDIAYSVGKYYESTLDMDFMKKYGFEILLETARFWKNFGNWEKINDKKQFVFNTVTGPDEYTALVNNNYYTNMMAKNNMLLAYKFGKLLEDRFPGFLKSFGISNKKELNIFKKIADNVFLPFSNEKQINEQDDSFFNKPVWPFDKIPKDNYPLLLHYHPLTIYKYQVDKQADTILADFLFPNSISKKQLQKEFDYYEAITTHDSSLSRSIFGIVAARLGNMKKAYSYFMDTVRMDLIDLQGNTADGLHLANLGGSWMSIIEGFGGMVIEDNVLSFNPKLPVEWESYNFRIKFQGRLLQINISNDNTNISLLSGNNLSVKLNGNLVNLKQTY